jgi:hypothetical protein
VSFVISYSINKTIFTAPFRQPKVDARCAMPNEFRLLTLIHHGDRPSVEEAARHFNLRPEDLDQQYGIILINPTESQYSIRVVADRIPTTSPAPTDSTGPFADPPIAPFGRPDR